MITKTDMTITSSLEFTFMQFQTPHIAAKKISTLSPGISRKWLITSHKFVTVISNIVLVIRPICDPTALNELRWYSVTMQNVTIFDLQVKNKIKYWFLIFIKIGCFRHYSVPKHYFLMVKCAVLWQFQAF